MTRRRRVQAVAGLAGVIAVSSALAGRSAFSAPSLRATTPGQNGHIAFKRFLDSGHSTSAIFTIGADGTGERRVTSPDGGVTDDQPDWSPDGSLLVFFRCAPNVPCAVYTVKANGSQLTRLSPPCSVTGPGVETKCEDGANGAFLPDGKHVVYTRSWGKVRHFSTGDQIQHSAIAVREVSGGGLRLLARSRPYEGDYLEPHFSPDGSRFVYVRGNSAITKPAGAHALFVARADGSVRRRITPWSLDAGDNPDWSPNGKLILFRSYEGGEKQSQIYVIRPDGTRMRALTHFRAGTMVLSYSFSPDGKRITFGKSGRGGEPDVFVMRANGTGIRAVTRTALSDSAPDWGAARG
jgi:TolB protein